MCQSFFRNHISNFAKILLKKLDIWLNILLSKILNNFGIMVIDLNFFFKSCLPFLWIGVLSVNLRIGENLQDLIERLKALRSNSLKILLLVFKILTGMSESWDAFLWLVSLFLNLPCNTKMLGWFMYFKMAFKVESFIFFAKGSNLE